MFAIAFLGLMVAVTVWLIGSYNGLVGLRNRFKNAFSQIDIQLKRRHDLIPNLVETARAYLAHERETLEAVIQARNTAMSAQAVASADPTNRAAIQGLDKAEGALNGALGRLLAVAEGYPDLKANQVMAQVSEELTSTENKIAFARQAFNDAVTDYNTAIQQFPNVLLANTYGFHSAELMQFVESVDERRVPQVRF